MIDKETTEKIDYIMECAKRVARQKYGMYLKHGEMIVDKTRYMGKMKVDDEDLMNKVLWGLDELLQDGYKE